MKHIITLLFLSAAFASGQIVESARADGKNVGGADWKTNLGFLEAADVAASYQPLIANGSLPLNKLAQTSATSGQVLKWTGSTWAPAVDTGGELAIGRSPVISAFWSDEEENLKLAISNDGLSFTQFATNLVSGPNGSLRDPSLIYHNGYWYVAFTNNSFNASTSFSIFRSNDLLTWSSHATVSLSSITGLNKVWSPHLIVTSDGSVRAYVAGNDGTATDTFGEFSIYHLLGSSDLSTWGSPTVVLSRSAGTKHYIDPFVIEEDGTFYMFVKEEYSDFIEVASSASPSSGFTMARTGNWGGWGAGKEGVAITKTMQGYRIYMDHYATGSGYKCDNSSNLLSGWSGSLSAVSNTAKLMRHGSFVPLNKTEYHVSVCYAYISSLTNSTLPYGSASSSGVTLHNGLKIETLKDLSPATSWAQLILSHKVGTGTYKGAIMLVYNDQLQFCRGINADGEIDPNTVMVDVPMGTRMWDFKTGIKVSGGPTWTAGSNSPEGVVTAPIGSLFSRTNGGVGTTLYVKQSGTGNTGWAAK